MLEWILVEKDRYCYATNRISIVLAHPFYPLGSKDAEGKVSL